MPSTKHQAPSTKTVTIIGLGLIGGSLALSLRQLGLAQRLIGVEHDAGHARRALALGLVTKSSPTWPRPCVGPTWWW